MSLQKYRKIRNRLAGDSESGRTVRGLISRNNSKKRFVGSIDEVSFDQVRGWAADTVQTGRPLEVTLKRDGNVVWRGTAGLYREDLEKAGYGTGHHSFRCRIPVNQLLNLSTLSLCVKHEARETVVNDFQIVNARISSTQQTVYIDVSDLLEFLFHHQTVSGIQRVQVGYITGLLALKSPELNFEFCGRSHHQLNLAFIDKERLLTFLSMAEETSGIAIDEWRIWVDSFRRSLSTRIEFKKKDVLLSLGAPWAVQRHSELIRLLKLAFEIVYFQIFYDMIPIVFPEVVDRPLIPIFSEAIAGMISNADHIFSISRASKLDLEKVCNNVGRLAPPTSIISMGGTVSSRDMIDGSGSQSQIVNSSWFSKPFVLCVGTIEPRKNHILLYYVWKKLVETLDDEAVPSLILVGRYGWHMDEFRRIMKSSANLNGKIIHLEGVSNSELNDLYRKCAFTVFPSLYEGWGLPITESLIQGKVCVCSNTTSMPEAGGEFAFYIDPYSITTSFDTILRLVTRPELVQEMEMKIVSDYKLISWENAGNQFYNDLVSAINLHDTNRTAVEKGLELGVIYNFSRGVVDGAPLGILNHFLKGQDNSKILGGSNWFDPEENLTWSCGTPASIAVALHPRITDNLALYLDLRVAPYNVGETFSVYVDGEKVLSLIARNLFRICIELPGNTSFTSKSSRNHLVTFTYDNDSVVPGSWEDQRLLGFAMEQLYLCTNIYENRLQFAERDFIASPSVRLNSQELNLAK